MAGVYEYDYNTIMNKFLHQIYIFHNVHTFLATPQPFVRLMKILQKRGECSHRYFKFSYFLRIICIHWDNVLFST